MGFFSSMEIAASGMYAQRFRINVISSNIANADTVQTPEGGPYKKREVIFETKSFKGFPSCLKGVQIADIVRDDSPPKLKYDPSNPLANAQGYVAYPNINPVVQMTDLIDAIRTYQANMSVIRAAKQMAQGVIGLLRA